MRRVLSDVLCLAWEGWRGAASSGAAEVPSYFLAALPRIPTTVEEGARVNLQTDWFQLNLLEYIWNGFEREKRHPLPPAARLFAQVRWQPEAEKKPKGIWKHCPSSVNE